jgi:hypothetical protein
LDTILKSLACDWSVNRQGPNSTNQWQENYDWFSVLVSCCSVAGEQFHSDRVLEVFGASLVYLVGIIPLDHWFVLGILYCAC